MKTKELLDEKEIKYPNLTEEHLGSVNEEIIRRSSFVLWNYFEENDVDIESYLESDRDIVKKLYEEHGRDIKDLVEDRPVNTQQFDTAARLAAKLYHEGYDEVVETFDDIGFEGAKVTMWEPTLEVYEPTEEEIEKDQQFLAEKAEDHDEDN